MKNSISEKSKGLKKWVLTIFGIVMLSALEAKQIPTVTGIIKSVPPGLVITVGTANATDTIQTPVVSGTADYNVINTIRLRYDLSTDTFFLGSAKIEVKLTIDRWDNTNTPMTTRSEKLDIYIDNRYGKQTIEQSVLKLSNGYKVAYTIDSIWINGTFTPVLPRYVSVEADINLDRYYDFSSSASTAVSAVSLVPLLNDCDTLYDELEFTWTPNVMAEEYQVEWSFINNYSADGTTTYGTNLLNADFKNNSTRITTYDNSYKISLLYDRGFVAFRVRAVGRNYLSPDEYIYGPWSVSNNQPLLSTLSSDEVYEIPYEHEKLKNWQYSASFAEEGKKKEVVNYFDGSLRNRQSVTKINSDNNIIVGETIYDYQGRAAVSVMPVPLLDTCSNQDPAIRYYVKFNVDTANNPYSKDDFDLDTSSCVSATAPMDTLSGASQYYSNNNTKLNAQQAYLPHAKKYPFSQTEYTPDNTGRIKSQSSVGKDYQLGSGKETKYLYGQPNQIQLDRLFGTEAGDASHYKKNVVIDANGQVSVTYLNQQGKTVATALAGEPPMDTIRNAPRLDSLESANSNQKTFTIDLFNKNAAGVSVLNKLLPGTDKIAFNSQLLVSFAGTHSFRYDVVVDTLADACLKSGFCMGCAYNFDIEVRNECGEELVTIANGGVPMEGVIGKVDTTGGNITFNMLCSGSSLFQDSAKFNLYLQPGVYTVSKILELNKDARDFFVNGYLDTAYNSCVKTYDDFLQEELSKIDTTDCYVTCASCAADLGAKDDFVSSGRGTAAQYDFLLEQCMDPCKIKTICETAYEMMLSDVSPGGQYGRYNSVTNDASGQTLSLFNTSNLHSSNIISSQANWHYPRILLNGNWYNMYLDEDGNRTKAIVSKSGTSYMPPVNDTTKVYYDSTLNISYTYPENLSSLADFLPLWTPSFARSIVLYHPEYAYFRSCKDHSVKFPADTITSDQFDSLLFVTNSFGAAVTNGFIQSSYATAGPAIGKIVPFWSTTGSGIKDPFFTNSNYQYLTTINSVTGAKTNVNMSAWPTNYNIQSEIDSLMNNYMIIAGIPYSMADVASMTIRSGAVYFSPPPPVALAFGMDFYGVASPKNDSIRDQEWKTFRQFYYSAKQKLQFKRMEFYAKHCDDAMSNYFGGSNCCFENSSYNPVAEQMLVPLGWSYASIPISAYGDFSQPCRGGLWWYYSTSKKRFINPEKTGLNTSSAAQLAYQASGQCPIALQFQGLINSLISKDKFVNNSPTLLDSVPEFVPDLYSALNGTIIPVNYVHYAWKVTASTDTTMTVNIRDTTTGSNKCTITFSISGTSIPVFDSIVSISQLKHDGSGTGSNPFYAVALCKNGSSMYSDYIRGNSCFRIESCSFPETCTPNQFAGDMEVLLSVLKRTDSLQAVGPYPIYSDSLLGSLLTTQIKNTLGTPNSKIIYEFISPDKFVFYDTTNLSTKLVFTILSISDTTITLDSLAGFININSAYNNLFTMQGVDTNWVVKCRITALAQKVTSTDTTGISMGQCGLPESPECSSTEHKVRADLERLVSAVLSTGGPYTGLNLYSFPELSSLLQTYLPPGLSTSSATYDSSTVASPNYDTLYFDLDDCGLELHHYRNNGTTLNFDEIVLVNNLEGIGSPDVQGNYYTFSAIATYSVALDSLVTDTIYGYSCFPIKNCPHCTGVDTITNNSTAANNLSLTPPVASPINQAHCDSLYLDYLAALASYNASYYATTTGYILSDVFTDSTIFWKSGKCECVDEFIDYLYEYDTATVTTRPYPQNLDTYNCPNYFDDPEVDSPCQHLYSVYLSTVNQYNDSVTSGYIPYPSITQIVSNAAIARYCDCAKKYISNITALIHGASIPIGVPVSDYLVFKYACTVPTCINDPDSAIVATPYTKYDNPCVQQMMNMAAFNAANNWQNYKDSLSTVIGSRYTAHCLNAIETYKDIYDDKEFHFTLYYYDQAGNLVKTIPPEGTEPVDITSYTDPLAVKINNDRTYGTHSVYTSHRMATTYEYNSLNQLVYQSMPDHDNISLCEANYPTGLDTSLNITSMQFVTPSKGYLCGYIKTSSSIKRGMMYTSNDGGTSWTRVNGMTSGNIKKVHFPSSTTGYAVADYGLVYKTTDGGNTWDLLKTLYAPTSGGKYFDGLYDVFFKDSLNGVVAGVKTSAHQGIYYTTNGGASFTGAVITNLTASDTVTSFSYDGGKVFATTSNGSIGKVFYSSNLTSWTKLSNFVANNLKKIQFIYDTLAFAVGEDGTLLRATSPSVGWVLLPTGTASNFRDVWFKNRAEGVALIDSVSGYSLLYKTLDGGATWEPLDSPGNHYYSLQGYKPDTGSYKIMAAGRNGLLTKVLMNTPPFGIIKLPTPTVRNFGYADAFSNDTIGSLLTVGITANSGRIYLTHDAQAGTINWKTYRADSLGVTAADTSFKKILISVNDSVLPHIKSVILTNNGKLYSFFKTYGGTPVMNQISVGGSYFFSDISSNTKKDTTNFYAIDSVSKTVYRIKFNASNVAQAVQYSGALSGGNGNIQSFDVSDENQKFLVGGNTGHIDYGSLSGSTITWTDATDAVRPGLLNKVRMMQVNKGLIVGTDGQTWRSDNATSKWYLTKSNTVQNLTALDADSTGTGLIGTGTGLVYQLTNGLSFAPTLTSLGIFNSAGITHAAIDTISDRAYMTMNDGKMLYIPSYSSASPQLASTASSNALNGVAFKHNGNAYAVGNKAGVFNYVGTMSAVRKELFNRLYTSTHFYDANSGFIIDSSRVIRHTTDGGLTWSVVLPDTTLPSLNKVCATTGVQGIIIGNSSYAAVINSNVVTKITVPGGVTHLYDIDFNRSSTGYGVIVGSRTRAMSITSSGPTTYAMALIGNALSGLTSPDFRAVRVFNDSTFLAAGKSGVIYYYTSSSFVRQQAYTLPAGTLAAAETFNDIFFHDDHTGYVVGDNGAVLKCDLEDKISVEGTVIDNIAWSQFCTTALYDPYTTNAQIQNLNFMSIYFPTRTKGLLVGGDANYTTPFFSQKYARLVNDQGSYYSTRFWYDRLGRMVISQNTKQFNKVSPDSNNVTQAFSYTRYDALGRIIEVGEKYENHDTGAVTVPTMKTIFGADVSGFTNPQVIDDTKLNSWLTSTGSRREVTRTYYDTQAVMLTSLATQQNLRKRVATVTYENINDNDDSTFQYATHYSYDIHGNVKNLWQENPSLAAIGQSIKRVDYEYDLISGKVNKVIYQPDSVDQFMHRYDYDADNRITKVETSKDNVTWEQDAKYFYYDHGPLARIEYGKDQVQGYDFAYTLQGWIKGVNSNILDHHTDMGRDGDTTGANPNGYFAQDAVGYSLGYYQGDYEAVDYTKWNNASTRWEAYLNQAGPSNYSGTLHDLYNGNITRMVTTISNPDTTAGAIPAATKHYPLGTTYWYDQLNRLTQMNAYKNIDTVISTGSGTSNKWLTTGNIPNLYLNKFKYDANGNIKTQVRYDSSATRIDSLLYKYENNLVSGKLKRNRLYHVRDSAGATTGISDDIEDQGIFTSASGNINKLNNYRYDEIGNLVRDSIEGIDTISWTVYGKIKHISYLTGPRNDLYFDYDPAGNRIAKHTYANDGTWLNSTFYVRDAQGNVMSIYKEEPIAGPALSYKLQEQHLYGSSRLGVAYPGLEMIGALTNLDTSNVMLGQKQYELSNHLGNVLTTVSDRKIALDLNTDSVIDYYVADIASANDYYPFGSPMYGRKFSSPNYRYGLNGQEKDDEVTGGGNTYSALFWEYDARLGRRWNLDPKPTIGVSDYACFLDNPIYYTDPNGDKVKFDDAKSFFKVVGKAITDKGFRKQLLAQHRATRITSQEVTDSKGGKHYEDVEHDQVFHYRYNKQSENSIQEAANILDNELSQRESDGDHSSKNHYSVAFSDNTENVILRSTGNTNEFEGPKDKSSDQLYKSGTITINRYGTNQINNSTVSFYHGATPIPGGQNIPIPPILEAGAGKSSMIGGISIPFEFRGYAKIRMVVTGGNTKSGNPGAMLLNVNITRP